ncbi:vWA domain-containing protein [Rhodopseudomonas sp. P2A-2r]|uniref:vWA domain-containing protein n=1 Tax=unclassified Rhodopseudomonas TaxID=2638247 RepID=UPI002233ECAB|nr:VWA domain-containing protein [Rhodopseudomonas sp. P2A-2r]UZE51442.1 VWA domain-containing protein [Rhodopseudomonas sp. P2A-2r]
MTMDHLNPPTGQMADNVIGFARALRAAGLPVGPGAVIDALNAIQLIEIGRRADLFTTLQAIFVKRHEHALVFAQAFDLFFRAAEEWKHLLDSVPLPDQAKKPPPPASRRVQEAMSQPSMSPAQEQPKEQEIKLSVSDREVLQKKDFAQMSAAEIAQVTRAIAAMSLPQAELRTRRFQPDARGLKLDLRRTLRGSLRTGGDIVDIRRLGLIDRPAPIVALLDISGSMSEYTRLFLHFLHAITDARKRVSVFLFGTRLTNVTRALRARDPDEALASCSASVEDWAGGTRISESLHSFNKLWGRRVLGQGAIVLLISDGLEREADAKLSFEMDRLHRSCRRLIWLNPLLRFDGFEAKAQGIKMMLPHVDEFRPVHNLSSMEGLIKALSAPPPVHHRSLIRPAA